MKQEKTRDSKPVRLKKFCAALLLSLAMVGAACLYAYQATTSTIERNLEQMQAEHAATTTATDHLAEPYHLYATEPATTDTDAAPEPESSQAWEEAAHVQAQVPLETTTDAAAWTLTEAVTEPEPDPELITTAAAPEPEPESEPEPEPTDPPLVYAHVLVLPLQGDVIQPFSNGELVKSETTGTWQTHNGADLAGAEGTAVAAMDNGTVSEIVKDPLWGICVKIDHGNGVTSRYCGLHASLSVQEGDTVESGQTIGSVGMTADVECKQPPHLHFEVQKNGIYVDPIDYVTQENA